jgi:hypothetical protein
MSWSPCLLVPPQFQHYGCMDELLLKCIEKWFKTRLQQTFAKGSYVVGIWSALHSWWESGKYGFHVKSKIIEKKILFLHTLYSNNNRVDVGLNYLYSPLDTFSLNIVFIRCLTLFVFLPFQLPSIICISSSRYTMLATWYAGHWALYHFFLRKGCICWRYLDTLVPTGAIIVDKGFHSLKKRMCYLFISCQIPMTSYCNTSE